MGQGYFENCGTMTEIKYYNLGIQDHYGMVYSIRVAGFKQGKDFDFAYYPTKWDNFSYEPVDKEHVVFTFYNESAETWFRLKYE